MFNLQPCVSSHSCQADSACERVPRFQIRLDARQPETHRSAEACASHLGDLVVALAAWAREQGLASADLTVLTIAPPAGDRQHVPTNGLVFSTIRLLGHGAMPAAEPASRTRP